MQYNISFIEDLIERFFEGGTSCGEEKMLYDFFSGDNIPAHLKSYVPIFGYFDKELENEINDTGKNLVIQYRSLSRIRRKGIYALAGIAASILLVLTISIFHNVVNAGSNYAGSYIVINGQRIDDPDIIAPEMERFLAEVTQQAKEIEDAMDEFQLIEDEIDNIIGNWDNTSVDDVEECKLETAYEK